MNRAPQRGFHGLWQIVQFNWPFYLFAIVALVAFTLVATTRVFPQIISAASAMAAILIAWLLFASLFVSHWIYDRSPLCEWKWLSDCLASPLHIANLHAGFDNSTDTVRDIFPRASVVTLDFYNSATTTEQSIARARRLHPQGRDVKSIEPDHWLLADASYDAVLLLLAAHELRAEPHRIAFFREARRVLQPAGRVVLAEHLRDFNNFLAFGPGFLHFLSRNAWCRTIARSGFRIEREFPITPFVRVFILQRDVSIQ